MNFLPMVKPADSIVAGIQKYFLLGMLLLLLVAFFFFISSFLTPLLIAAITVATIYPLHKNLRESLRVTNGFSAFITFVLVTLLIVTPLTWFFFSIVGQATDAYGVISNWVNQTRFEHFDFLPWLSQNQYYEQVKTFFDTYNPVSVQDIVDTLRNFVGSLTSLLVEQTTTIVKQVTVIVLQTIVFLLAMFYFIRDGEKLVGYIHSLIPLSIEHRDELFKKIHYTMRSIILGFFGVAVVQGFLVTMGLSIVGIQNAIFWGAVAAIFSAIPFVGTGVVWFPVVLVLAISQEWGWSFFLLLWGVFVVGLSDNFIRPYLIGTATTLHPFVVFLVLIGGVFAFGFRGLIFGPLMLTLLLAVLHIYRLQYAKILSPRKVQTKAVRKRKSK